MLLLISVYSFKKKNWLYIGIRCNCKKTKVIYIHIWCRMLENCKGCLLFLVFMVFAQSLFIVFTRVNCCVLWNYNFFLQRKGIFFLKGKAFIWSHNIFVNLSRNALTSYIEQCAKNGNVVPFQTFASIQTMLANYPCSHGSTKIT